MIYEGVTRGFNDASHFIFLDSRLLGVSERTQPCGIYFWVGKYLINNILTRGRLLCLESCVDRVTGKALQRTDRVDTRKEEINTSRRCNGALLSSQWEFFR